MNEMLPPDLVAPPSWSLTVGLIGRVLILMASGLFGLSCISWIFSRRSEALAKIGKFSFTGACLSIIGAFLSLGILFANNRFEYAYVYGHTDLKNALAYRIAGIWSGQEGSFLLWATCAAFFAILSVRKMDIYRRWYTVAFAFFLGGITSILAFESPFNLNQIDGQVFVPPDGLGLAPSLQNYWVIIHPPTIFMGFASLTVLFALAFAALVERNYSEWAQIVRPWAIVSATLVGLGLCMGGFWAYETLGWGGFWMWDPVEIVSFVPWCFTIALIHGVIVQSVRKKWHMSNLLMGGLPFIVFIYGTFLTRSGFLADASVHSFAEMNRSALKLLVVLMGGTTLGFFCLWGFRAFQARKEPKAEESEAGLRREAFYLLGILTMLVMGIATMIGMSVPLVMALRGQKPSVVEEALYHQVLPWIFVPLMILMGITPFVAWRGMKPKEFVSRVYSVLCITIGVVGLALFLAVVTPASKSMDLAPMVKLFGKEFKGLSWFLFLVGTCAFVLIGNIWRVAELVKRSKLGVAPFVMHAGVAILMCGLIISRAFEQVDDTIVMKDHPGRLLAYEVQYKGMTSNVADRDNRIILDITDPHNKNAVKFTAYPGLYNVNMGGQENVMVWPYIKHGLLMDTYVSLGQPQTDASQDVTLPVGGQTQFGGLTLKYKEMTRDGEAGKAGTKFGALVEVTGDGKTETVHPQMGIGQGGPKQFPAPLDDNMQLAMIGMNAADKSVTLRVQLTTPMYPVQIYHKPLVGLVWLGTGIMTIGGILSAIYRRPKKRNAAPNVNLVGAEVDPLPTKELINT